MLIPSTSRVRVITPFIPDLYGQVVDPKFTGCVCGGGGGGGGGVGVRGLEVEGEVEGEVMYWIL